MAENYDPARDLARMVIAGLSRGHDAPVYADRIAEHLGLVEGDSAEAAEKALRKALGARACKCAIDGPGLVIPPACPVHGVPCESCGELEGCEEDCGGEDDADAAPFDNGMHFTESLCPSSLPLTGRSPVPCHLELHHRGPHGSLGEPLQWVGAGDAARAIEAHHSPVIAERRMRAALGYDRQAHLAWYDQKYPLRVDRPAEPHNEAATLAAVAEYANGQVTP